MIVVKCGDSQFYITLRIALCNFKEINTKLHNTIMLAYNLWVNTFRFVERRNLTTPFTFTYNLRESHFVVHRVEGFHTPSLIMLTSFRFTKVTTKPNLTTRGMDKVTCQFLLCCERSVKTTWFRSQRSYLPWANLLMLSETALKREPNAFQYTAATTRSKQSAP